MKDDSGNWAFKENDLLDIITSNKKVWTSIDPKIEVENSFSCELIRENNRKIAVRFGD